jgi:hypothetical protein
VNIWLQHLSPVQQNLPESTNEIVTDDMLENNDYFLSETETFPFMMLN